MTNILLFFIMYTGIGIPIACLLNNRRYNNWQKVLGEGFFIGVFIVILALNILQYFTINTNLPVIFYSVLIFSTLSIIYFISKNINTIAKTYNSLAIDPNPDTKNTMLVQGFDISESSIKSSIINKLITGIFMTTGTIKHIFISGFRVNKLRYLHVLVFVIIIWHLYYIISQNQALPLIPWDAWYGWIAKAQIWFYHGINEPLVTRSDWLLGSSGFTNLISHYPDGLSLLYVFNASFYGWNETALNALYPAMFIAFLLAFFGNIKLLTQSAKYAWLSILLLCTVPIINVHVTLAGYADIWVAAFLALSLFNAQYFLNIPKAKSFILPMIFAICMIMFKQESWVWLGIFLMALMLSMLSEIKRKWLYIVIILLVTIWYLVDGFVLFFPFGELIIRPNLIKVPMLGSYPLTFVDTTSAWIEALFFSNNWSLLWFSIPMVVFFTLKTQERSILVLPSLFLVFTIFFLYVLFYLTYASNFANDFTSSNRVVMHIVPVYIYFLMQVICQYQKQKDLNKALERKED